MSSFRHRSAGIQQNMLEANFDFNGNRANWTGWWGTDTTDIWDDGVLWPNSRIKGSGQQLLKSTRFEPPPREYGGQQMKKIIGTTRDSTGAVLGEAVVQGFLTATDQYLREVTSDAGGYFEFCSEFSAVGHYLVAYKAGSPDVAGTTLNTLTPT